VITVILVLIIIVFVAAFSVQNAVPVAVSFLAWHYEASLALVVVLSLLLGIVFGMALLSLLRIRRSLRARRKSAGSDKTTVQNPR
jgi:uncharacterized integral membrane protein